MTARWGWLLVLGREGRKGKVVNLGRCQMTLVVSICGLRSSLEAQTGCCTLETVEFRALDLGVDFAKFSFTQQRGFVERA